MLPPLIMTAKSILSKRSVLRIIVAFCYCFANVLGTGSCYHSKKLKLHYTRGITSKRVTSGGAQIGGLALGQHNSEETTQRWRAVGKTVSDFTGPGIKPHILLIDSYIFNHYMHSWKIDLTCCNEVSFKSSKSQDVHGGFNKQTLQRFSQSTNLPRPTHAISWAVDTRF